MKRFAAPLRRLIAGCLPVLSIWLATAHAIGPVIDGAVAVEFESAPYTYAPTAFRLKQAKKLGKPVVAKTEPSVPLVGYLARPKGEWPRPAVVLLHTCAGLSQHEQMWSDRLVDWGFVVLNVDSLTPRGLEYICDGRIGSTTPWHRALDAYGAKLYLSMQSFVDPDRIAVMGMSHGGVVVLEVARQPIAKNLKTKPFQAAIAYYPYCGEPSRIDIPTLLLIGSEDNWTPAELCEQYLARLPPESRLTVEVFAGAHHLFDLAGIDLVELGFVLRSHPAAAARASRLTREFLQKHF